MLPFTLITATMFRLATTRAWFQSLIDCPPGRCRSGYGLLEAWWSGDECNHACCAGAMGCILRYHQAAQDVDRALEELVFKGYLEPATKSQPLRGHTHNAHETTIAKIRPGIPWDQKVFESAYVYGFDPTAKLIELMERGER